MAEVIEYVGSVALSEPVEGLEVVQMYSVEVQSAG